MLAQTERAKGASAGGKKEGPHGHYIEPRDNAPTLAELGLSKRESAEAQRLAAIPAALFEEVAAGNKSLAAVQRETRQKKRCGASLSH